MALIPPPKFMHPVASPTLHPFITQSILIFDMLFATSLSIEKFQVTRVNRLLKRSNIIRFVRYCKLFLILLFIAACAWTAYDVVDRRLASGNDIALIENNIEKKLQELEKVNGISEKEIDFKKIAEANIFGKLGAMEEISSQIDDAPKKSTAELSLVGTFIDGGEPLAIIADTRKKAQDIFTTGQSIFDEATLVSIAAESVEIRRGTSVEILYLDDGGGQGSSLSNSSSGASQVADEGANVEVDAAKLDAALENLPLLLTQARAVPYFKNGRSVGLRMFAIKNGSLFQEIGLKNGDILKTINGNSLADITQAIKLFEKLKEERSIELSLERSKKDVVYNYSIK